MTDKIRYQVGDTANIEKDNPVFANLREAKVHMHRLNNKVRLDTPMGVWNKETGECVALFYDHTWSYPN